MSFLKDLFDTFVPNEKNGYKPHFFRVKAVLSVAAFIAVVGVGSLLLQKVILENSNYLAAVIASAVVELTNGDRAAEALGTLSVNPLLERAAQLKAEDMAAQSYFAHTSPDGTTPWYWFDVAGYDFVYAGENLAVRFYDSAEVVRAWMNSPGHRANILNDRFTEIGIGIAEGVFEGKQTVFVVQMFGTPQPTPISLANVEAPLSAAEVVEETDEPTVAGVETSEEVVKETTAEETVSEAPEVIVKEENFIAVKSDTASATPATSVSYADSSLSLSHALMTSPQSLVKILYAVMAGLVGIALLIMVIFEARHQHLGNVILGVSLLLLMAGFLFLGHLVFPESVVIL